MKNCPNCNAEVDNDFELCWNCNYSFTDGKVIEIKDEPRMGDRELDCLRCGTSMSFIRTHKFHEGFPMGIIGALGEILVNREFFDLYICSNCGKIEFFRPLTQKNR